MTASVLDESSRLNQRMPLSGAAQIATPCARSLVWLHAHGQGTIARQWERCEIDAFTADICGGAHGDAMPMRVDNHLSSRARELEKLKGQQRPSVHAGITAGPGSPDPARPHLDIATEKYQEGCPKKITSAIITRPRFVTRVMGEKLATTVSIVTETPENATSVIHWTIFILCAPKEPI